jgi:hypothetical protein
VWGWAKNGQIAGLEGHEIAGELLMARKCRVVQRHLDAKCRVRKGPSGGKAVNFRRVPGKFSIDFGVVGY